MMINALRMYGYPQGLIDLTENIYTDSTFQVETKFGLTESIERHRGIIQGCPYSVIAFEQGIDIWLRWLYDNNIQPSIPNKVQGYVDDIVNVTTDEASMVAMASKTEVFLEYSGMKVKHRKCAILHGQRSGNNWYRRDTTDSINITLQGKVVPKIGKAGTYQYLGHDISLDGKAAQSQATDVFNTLSQILNQINDSVLPVVSKLEAINTMVMSKLNFYLSNITLSITKLDTFEDQIVSHVRSWFGLNKSSNRDFMFISKNNGGLGIINPATTYIAKKISFLLSVLNSDDPQTRHCARFSLDLHMNKRKVDKDNSPDSSFAGYGTDGNGRLVKQCAVNWPKSVWIELNELCMREDLTLDCMRDDFVIIVKDDNEVSLALRDPTAIFNHIKNQHMTKRIARFKTKVSQGRILNTSGIDYQISNHYLSKTELSDNLVKFILKCRLQLLECNSLLNLYYPQAYQNACPLCNNQSDTVSHILNGCMDFRNMHIRRHDRIVNHIHQEITRHQPNLTVYNNCIVTANMFSSESHGLYQNIQHNKPDLLIIDDHNKKVYVVEVSVPFDDFMDRCYQTKFDYYQPLSELITVDTDYTCKVVVLIVGSTGCVHKKVVTGLKMLGFRTFRGKAVAKYISISAAIGSNIIWQMRVRAVKAN